MNLRLSLKTKWFEMTKAGVKTEDYREINEYWIRRLLAKESYVEYLDFKFGGGYTYELNNFDIDYVVFKKFSANTMTLGYPSNKDNERIITFEHAGIEVRAGNPEFGADPDKLYFVIKHGKKIK